MYLAIDVLLVLAVVAAFISGWRQGALSAVVSAVGVVAGLVVGLALAPFALEVADSQTVRIVLLVALIVLFVGVGNLVGITVGGNLRGRMRSKGRRVVDSVLGAAFQSVAVAAVLWFISIPLAASVPGSLGDGIRSSRVFSSINAAAPASASKLPAKLAALLDESGLPPLVSPFESPRGANVAAPDDGVVEPEVVEKLRPSVVHVMGDAESCRRRLMGSGFVIEDGYVLTNAHVVAGTERVALDTVVGVKPAQVVLYDPDTDIAVLRAEDLGLPALRWAEDELAMGDDAVVMGHPKSGPFQAAPVRIRGKLEIAGPDIYTTGRVEREAYTIRGNIRQGNSGGPLLTPEGEAAGMIFGASLDTSETGYALTAHQVQQRVGDVRSLTRPADTQACVSG
ncbi:MarP family serine protease [Corynebacterium fournieri]|uniref:MarP family serine protease n=1 Tax=Corynebacterium fournieri TaxID=1852390 RepID=UPI000A2F209D|nr:MarP family serine protease [Corynebacterium fournieri]WJY96604.1 Serine protease [Corynebacterium fournieri]